MLTADRQAADHIVTEALASTSDHPAVVEAQTRAGEAITELMQRAKDQGGLRKDFETQDLQLFFAGLGAAQHIVPSGSRAWRRLLGLLIDGLRAEAAHPVDEPALTRARTWTAGGGEARAAALTAAPSGPRCEHLFVSTERCGQLR